MARQPVRALVYGDVNLNVIDGSAIWAQSSVEVLAAAGIDVTVLLKTPVHTTRLVEPLERLDHVTLVRPFEDRIIKGLQDGRLTIAQAITFMRRLDEDNRFDMILVRGYQLALRLVEDGALSGRLWTYLTDIPQSAAAMDQDTLDGLSEVASGSAFMLCQTEELRTFLEGMVPAACGRSVLFPPVVPSSASSGGRTAVVGSPLRLVYSGKFAPLWNTLEMMRLPELLAARGIPAELHAIGDKIHRSVDDPDYHRRMRDALSSTRGVEWHGGQSRERALAISAGCDIGLSWRGHALDASLELSTKVLEYGSVGVPVVLNRTPMHEALLGSDYPLFAGSLEDVVDVIGEAAGDAGVYAGASAACAAAAERFRFDAAVARVRELLERTFPAGAGLADRRRPLRVGVASHDLKFFHRILGHLRSLPDVEVRIDAWPTLSSHDTAASQAMVDWADVVICEWFGPNAVWYSANRRAGQRLLVRLHRFELYRPWPDQARIDNIDQVVCVSDHYATLALRSTGWSPDKVTVIPNMVDVAEFDRPKLDGARFHLGFIGVAPARKRMDVALDVLAILREHDPRFRLFAKTKLPWEYPWIWSSREERAAFAEVLRRSQVEPPLRGAVVFDDFGADVAAWLRRVGWVLSTSDDESFHLAPAEGMASGAIPVVRNWPGADTIYDERWIHEDAGSMAAAILEISEGGRWASEGRLAQGQARDSFDYPRVVDAWVRLLTADPTRSTHEPMQATARPLA